MSTPRSSEGLVVVGYDGSPAAQRALLWAAAVSRVLGHALKIIHAVELDLTPSRRGYALRPLNPPLETVAETIVGAPSTWPGTPLARSRVHAVHAIGGPAAELVEASMTADLLVMGTRGRGRTRSALIGSVSSSVAARSYCPVVVLHDLDHPVPVAARDVPVPGPQREIVCAVTPGRGAVHVARVERILEAATALAVGCSAPLRIVTVTDRATDTLETPPAASATAVARAHPGLRLTTQTLLGDPVEVLTRTSRDCGLLAIGAPHSGGVAAVLTGTPAYRVIHDATCPVMLVH